MEIIGKKVKIVGSPRYRTAEDIGYLEYFRGQIGSVSETRRSSAGLEICFVKLNDGKEAVVYAEELEIIEESEAAHRKNRS